MSMIIVYSYVYIIMYISSHYVRIPDSIHSALYWFGLDFDPLKSTLQSIIWSINQLAQEIRYGVTAISPTIHPH